MLGRSVKNHYGHHLRGDQLCQSLPSSVKQKDNYSINGVWYKIEGAGMVSRFVFQFKTAWGESPRWVKCSPAQFGLLPCAPFNFLPVAGSLFVLLKQCDDHDSSPASPTGGSHYPPK